MNSIEKAVSTLDNAFERSGNDKSLADTDSDSAAGRHELRAVPVPGEHDAAQPVDMPDAQAEALVDQEPTHRHLVLPVDRLQARGMITPDAPMSRIAEEYRTIKRPLLLNMESPHDPDNELTNVIMVTSCREGEGKTFSAINLALSLSMERNRSVLLIDCDVAKGAASELLGFRRNEPGLTDVLLDDSLDIADCTWQTDIENLCCVPAGPASNVATELLGSHRMRELINTLARAHPERIIVFDTPPVLMTNEALVLTQHVGQIAFVVAAETTTHGMVSDALNYIQGSARIGLVLNKSRKKLGAGGYGYGYGYGYGQAEDPRQLAPRPVPRGDHGRSNGA